MGTKAYVGTGLILVAVASMVHAGCGGSDTSELPPAPDAGGVDAGVDVDVDANTGPAVCGNGTVEGHEQCDDGNRVNGDGCSAACTKEGGGPK